VTDDSGHGRKSVTFTRNEWSHSTGIVGHVRPESVVTRARNTQQRQEMIASNDAELGGLDGCGGCGTWHTIEQRDFPKGFARLDDVQYGFFTSGATRADAHAASHYAAQ